MSDGATTFTWNVAGKLSTTVNNGKTHAYRYNALDQRVSKNGSLGSKFTFFYDEAGQLIGEYRDNSTTATPTDDWLVRQETIWLEDIPVAVIRKPTATGPIQTYFIHADHLNTPTESLLIKPTMPSGAGRIPTHSVPTCLMKTRTATANYSNIIPDSRDSILIKKRIFITIISDIMNRRREDISALIPLDWLVG